MTPRAVTLDLWNTLIGEGPDGRNAPRRHAARVSGVLEALGKAGDRVETRALEDAFAAVRLHTAADHAKGTDMAFDARIRQLLSFVDRRLPDRVDGSALARIREALDGPFLAYPPQLLPGATEALEALSGRGVALAIISNTGLTSADGYRRFLEAHRLLRLFRVLSISTERGMAKPAAAMFRVTLVELGTPPRAALHAGDDLRADVAGAHRAGLRTAWISGVDPSEPQVRPDFTISNIGELPAVVDRWLEDPPPAR